MKKIILVTLLLFVDSMLFAQDTEAPTTPLNFQFSESGTFPMQPQTLYLQWEHATDNIGVTGYEVYRNGILYDIIAFDDSSGPIQYVSYGNLGNLNFCFTLVAKDAVGNSSPATNEICQTIDNLYPPQRPDDLYFSGYMNFNGDDKALELTNLTYDPINLSNYKIKISFDGNPTWDYTYTFPPSTILQNGETFVIAHSNISMCTTHIDDYNDVLTSFDGNDAIGLFRNDMFFIDQIGELGSTAVYAPSNTFLKVSAMPYTGLPTLVTNQFRWDQRPHTGTCPNELGLSTLVVLDTEEFTSDTFQIYPNPTNGNVFINSENNIHITNIRVLDLSGKQVFEKKQPASNINLQSLQKGVYILQIISTTKLTHKKLIKQ